MVFLDFLKSFDLDPAVFCPFDITGQDDDSHIVNSEMSNESVEISSDPVQAYDFTVEASTWPSSSETVSKEVKPSSPETEACHAGSGDIRCTQCNFCEPLEDIENGSDSFICSASNRVIGDIYTSASGCDSYYSS